MKLSIVGRAVFAPTVGALIWLATGCIGPQDLSTLATNDTVPPADTTVADATSSEAQDGADGGSAAESALLSAPDKSSAAASVQQPGLTDSELQLLQTALAGLVPGGTAGSSSSGSGGTPSLSDLKKAGLHKRDIAILALDVAAQQSGLTPEQSFVLRFTSALVSHDANAVTQLLVEQLFSAVAGGSTAPASQGANP